MTSQAGAATYRMPDDIKVLQQAARDLVQKEIIPLEEHLLDYDAIELPEEEHERIQKKVQEAGLWNMGVPEEYGGSNLSSFARAVISEELVQHRAGLYVTCYHTLGESGILGQGGAYGGFYTSGTEVQKEKYMYEPVPEVEIADRGSR